MNVSVNNAGTVVVFPYTTCKLTLLTIYRVLKDLVVMMASLEILVVLDNLESLVCLGYQG